MITSLVAVLLSAPVSAAPASDASFAGALTAAQAQIDPRAISAKALYWAAAQRSDVRDDLLDLAKRGDKTVRLAAIWSLFAVNATSVKDGLLDIARRNADESARVESLKSLYGAMAYSDVRDAAYDLARNTSTPAAVRKAAIVALGNPRSEELQTYFHLIRRDHNGVLVNDPLDAE